MLKAFTIDMRIRVLFLIHIHFIASLIRSDGNHWPFFMVVIFGLFFYLYCVNRIGKDYHDHFKVASTVWIKVRTKSSIYARKNAFATIATVTAIMGYFVLLHFFSVVISPTHTANFIYGQICANILIIELLLYKWLKWIWPPPM